MYSDILIPLALFIATVISAVLWHKYVPDNSNANIGSTITIIILVQVVDYLSLGYLNPFFVITIITSGAIAYFISYFLGPYNKPKNENN